MDENMNQLAGDDTGYPVCQNPECSSFGSSHPNCRCHGSMSDGGKVEAFCQYSRSHDKNCQYFADGGTVEAPSEPELTDNNSIKAYDIRTANPVEVRIPHTTVTQAVVSGEYTFPKDSKVTAFAPNGTLVDLPPENAPAAFNAGYKYASPSDIAEYDLQQKYGEGLGNEAASFGLGLANTASLGGFNQLAARSGLINPETLREIPKRNPISNIAGSATGILAPLAADVMSGGAATPGILGAMGAGVRGISKVGSAVETGVQALLPEATSTASKILSEGLSKGLAGATEGALFGIGDAIAEQPLGDPGFNSEAVMAHIGHSALLGGALGSAIGSGTVAIPAALNSAKTALGKLTNTIKNSSLGENVGNKIADAASLISGAPSEDIANVFKGRADLTKLPETLQEKSQSLTKILKNLDDGIIDSSDKVLNDLRPSRSELQVANIDHPAALQEYSRIDSAVSDTLDRIKNDPLLYNKRAVSKLEDFHDKFQQDVTSAFDISQEGLQDISSKGTSTTVTNKISQALDDLQQNIKIGMKYEKLPTTSATKELVDDLRNEISNTLKNPAVFGEPSARYAQFNATSQAFKDSREDIQKAFLTNGKFDAVKVNTFIKQMGKPEGEEKAVLLKNYMDNAQNYINHAETAYSHLPEKTFDKDAVQHLLEQVNDAQSNADSASVLQKSLNRLSEHGAGDTEALHYGAAHATGIPAPLVAAFYAAKHPLLTIQRIAKLEATVLQTTSRIEKYSKQLFKPVMSTAEAMSGYLGSKADNSLNTPKDYDKFSKKINETLGNSDTLAEKLQNSTNTLHDYAPKHALALQMTTMTALQFLKSKMPQDPNLTPLDKPMPITNEELSKFNRYYQVVENPLLALKQMKAGMLTRESVETLQAVYPKLYDHMKIAIMENVAKNSKNSILVATVNQLSLFLGIDLDRGIQQDSIRLNQSTMSGMTRQESDQHKMKSSAKSMEDVTVSQRFKTASQSTSQRN